MNSKIVCIIDSGCDIEHSVFKNIKILGKYSFLKKNNTIIVSNEISDYIGHGTAITSIIHLNSINTNYYIIKIFDRSWECDDELLLYALNFIYKNIQCDYINISCGITNSIKEKQLKEICDKIQKKGIVIISAFDNIGSISYPAYFNSVIGVDTDTYCKNKETYFFVENSNVNVFGYGNIQRVAWLNKKFMIVNGSSFACAHITAILINSNAKGISNSLNYLKTNAKYVFNVEKKEDIKQKLFINSAIAIPFNKEIKGLIDNISMLQFELKGVYDSPKLGNVGKEIKSLDNMSSVKIENIRDINWEEEFDTVIIGHMENINIILGYDLRYQILLNAIKKNKTIYSFDKLNYDILINYKKIYYPEVIFNDKLFGKFFDIRTPVLGIFGTSSKQGKFTLQLALRKRFIKDGYNIGQIGTEPSSILFGIDETFHIGFNSDLKIESSDFIQMINHKVKEIENNEVELIIGGCQSNTIPYLLKNKKYLNSRQNEFLLGLNPDCVILCINEHDDYNYIQRTINYIEGITNAKVLALVLYPFGTNNQIFISKKNKLNKSEIEEIKSIMLERHKISCYSLENEDDINKLYYQIIDFFS